MLSFLESLWHDVELPALHRKRPVHSCIEQYRSRKQEMNVSLLRRADACASFVTVPPSKTRHFNAGLRVSAARTFQKREFTDSYHWTLV